MSVLTFLEGEVNNASYILACSADAILASDSAQVENIPTIVVALSALCTVVHNIAIVIT